MNSTENYYRFKPMHFIPLIGVSIYAFQAGISEDITSQENVRTSFRGHPMNITVLSTYNLLLASAAAIVISPFAKGLESFLNQ